RLPASPPLRHVPGRSAALRAPRGVGPRARALLRRRHRALRVHRLPRRSIEGVHREPRPGRAVPGSPGGRAIGPGRARARAPAAPGPAPRRPAPKAKERPPRRGPRAPEPPRVKPPERPPERVVEPPPPRAPEVAAVRPKPLEPSELALPKRVEKENPTLPPPKA